MVIWKKINLNDKGIIVEKTPNIVKGKKRIETYEIEGKNGVLVLDKGTYGSFILSVECHFNSDNVNIEEVKEFLDGYGTLSLDGEKEYTAYIKNQIEFEKVLQFRKFIIQLEVNPIATDIQSTKVVVNSNNFDLNIDKATYNINPIIKLKGNGNVSISFNNKTFYLYDLNSSLNYYLDCEAKEIYDSNGKNCSNQMKYDFPFLKPNANKITYTGTITTFEIEYKRTYL